MTGGFRLAETKAPVTRVQQRVHRCSKCGAQDHWKDGWLWYGDHIKGVSKTLCPACSTPHQHEVIDP